MAFVAQVIKVKTIASEDKKQPASVSQSIMLTGTGDILCMQIHDSNYFVKPAFPGEESIVCADSVLFDCMFFVDDKGIHRKVHEGEFLELDKKYP